MAKLSPDKSASLSKVKILLLTCFGIVMLITMFFLSNKIESKLPTIQGVLLKNALPFEQFELTDHHNQVFTDRDFSNNWSLISYGYTQCPDVCPTTLMLMKRFNEKLKHFDNMNQIKLLFYTIDPLRDTQQVMQEYMSYFGDNFIGLRPNNNDSYLNFEQNLALKYQIKNPSSLANNLIGNSTKTNYSLKQSSYQVSHGLTLYLVNPEGNLQAILQPKVNPFGLANFTVAQIYQDFIISRQYYLKHIKK